MRRLLARLAAAALLAAVLPPVAAQAPPDSAAVAPEVPAAVEAARRAITGRSLVATIGFLASSGLEGREAGERGAELVADYLESRFEAAGLSAPETGFQQELELVWRVLTPATSLTLEQRAGSARRTRTLELEEDWLPLGFSAEGEVEAPLVFAGYGIAAPEHGWDDYAGLGRDGARGKVVLVFRHEPDENGSSAFFEGREMTLHASLRQKARAAREHGAVGLLVVDDPLHHEVPRRPTSSLARRARLDEEERALPAGDAGRRKGWPESRDEASSLGIAAALVSQELLAFVAPERDWKALQERMDGERQPVGFAFDGVVVRLKYDVEEEAVATANVLAVLPGSDPELAREYVVVGGHYDHEGKDPKSGEIYHGADDNASGTAAVVALAEAFAALPEAPARSLLFAAWSAEEKGLMGSDWFVHHPPVPLEQVVAAVNLDMIGRNDPTQISVVGRSECPDLVALFDRWAPTVGIGLNDDAGLGASRSDNFSFWLAGVPAASLFSGTHEDYHESGDVARKIVVDKVERATQLAFMVLWEVASGRVTPAPMLVPDGPWEPVAPPARRLPAVAVQQ